MYKLLLNGWFHFIFICSLCGNTNFLSNYLTEIELTELDSGIQSIDCIYVINLEERYDRWQRTQAICKSNGLFVNRVNAINGWKLNMRVLKELTTPHHRVTKGAIGCLLSHLSILRHALENQFTSIWIMEDDVTFVNNPHQICSLLKELTQIDPEWDIFYTDTRNHWNYVIKSIKQKNFITDRLLRVGHRYGTHSIILSKKGLKKVFKYFSEKKISTPIDIDIHSIPNIRKYSPAWHITSVVENSISDTEIPVN